MAKTATVRARIEPEIKQKAEKVFSRLGVSASEVISMLMHHVALNKKVPLDLRIPNTETREAIKDALSGKPGKTYATVEEMFADILASILRSRHDPKFLG